MKAIITIKILKVNGIEIKDDMPIKKQFKASTEKMLDKLGFELEKYFDKKKIKTNITYEVQDG